MTRSPKVIVIGGGIGGLTTALALHRRNIEVEIYEQAGQISEIGAGISLSPNGLKALRPLGIEDELLEIGFESPGHAMRAWDTGAVISYMDRRGVYERDFNARYTSIHRADLTDILRRQLPDHIFHLGKRCATATTTNSEAQVTFTDGSNASADLVIGADGIHSAVRKAVAGERAARFTGSVCWRGLVPFDSLPSGSIGKELTIFMGPKSHVIHYLVRRGELVNFVAHVETDSWTQESWTQECDRADALAAFTGWYEPLRQLIGSSERYYKWALFDRDPLTRWSKGRLVLMGDAAHPMLPHIGQGAVMAIEDGCALGILLDSHRDNIDTAIQRYQTLRIPRANKAVIDARDRGREMHAQSKFAQFARNIKMGLRKTFGGDKTALNLGAFYDYDINKAV